jgi:GntR family transcriptional regulator
LEIERLIVREKGKGTFIAEPKIAESLVQKLTGFYQDMEARGYTPVTQVLKMVVSPAEPTVAAYLDREPGTPVVEIDRLRFVHGEPIVYVVTYLVSGLVIERGRRTIEAVVANDREAELFQIRKGDPLILLNSVGYLKGRKPIEYYRALHRGDRTRFEVELVRMHEGGRLDLEDVPSSTGLVD